MNCPNCGKEIADDSIFCEFCGMQIHIALDQEYPQNYRTKYNNQAIYTLNTDYSFSKRSDGLNWSSQGSDVSIFTQYNGYGLSWWGWIPMDCLEK